MAKTFKEGDRVSINDGAGVRDGVVLRAPGDSYFVDTDHGPIWCGLEHVFAPGEAPLPPSEVPTDAPPAPEKGRRKKG